MGNILEKIEKFNLSNLYDNLVKSNKKISATLEVTSNCNFNCVHCYMCDYKESKKQLSFEEITKIIDILFDEGILFLTFSGGDPFVRNDFKEIYLYAKKKGFIVDIFTNGTLINEEWIKIFNEYPPLLIDISIYGATGNTYEKVTGNKNSFKNLIHSLELLHNSKIRFALKSPLLTINVQELEEMKRINNKYSTEPFRFNYDIVPDRKNNLNPLNYRIDPLDAVILEIKDGSNVSALIERGKDKNNWGDAGFIPIYFCSIGELTIHIDYSGNIYPCIECSDKYNIFEYSFDYICDKASCYKKIKANNNYKCIDCKALIYCSSCPQIRKRLYGNEQCVSADDCIVAKLKYKYYVENFSIEELERYYLNYKKEVAFNDVSKT